MRQGEGGTGPLRVVIAGRLFEYPEGMGAAARVHALATGFLKAGHTPLVLRTGQPSPPREGQRREASGVYEGVPFRYTHGSAVPHPNFFVRQWLKLVDPLRFYRAAKAHFAGCRPRAILGYSEEKTTLLEAYLISSLLGAVYVQDLQEYPRLYAPQSTWRKLETQVYLRLFFKLPRAFSAISSLLENLARQFGRKGARVLRVPILVETERFFPGTETETSSREIVFAGNLDHPGEVSGLLEVFERVAGEVPDARLTILGGSAKDDTTALLRKRAADLGVGGRVELAGLVPREEMPARLRKAQVLVLPRSAELYSRAGLPTKLAEYLASGKPVVVTATGDIPDYLEDGVSAYVVPPDDPDDFARGIIRVLTNPDEAKAVGARGRDVALRSFDNASNCRRLADLMLELAPGPA
jgi:glycosyltransferase involved in cell wall biosynthesis